MTAGFILSEALNPEEWHVVGVNPTVRTWHRYDVSRDGNDVTLYVHQEMLDPQGFKDSCAEDRALLEGKAWGEGQVIGRMPDAYYYTSGYQQARKNKDEPWIRRFWNDSSHAALRVKSGRV